MAQSATARYIPVGLNHGNQFFAEAIVPAIMAQNEVLTVTAPDSCDGLAPISVRVYNSSGVTKTSVITSHSATARTTAVTITDAAGAAAGDICIVEYIGG